jgi:hypothetical protein
MSDCALYYCGPDRYEAHARLMQHRGARLYACGAERPVLLSTCLDSEGAEREHKWRKAHGYGETRESVRGMPAWAMRARRFGPLGQAVGDA